MEMSRAGINRLKSPSVVRVVCKANLQFIQPFIIERNAALCSVKLHGNEIVPSPCIAGCLDTSHCPALEFYKKCVLIVHVHFFSWRFRPELHRSKQVYAAFLHRPFLDISLHHGNHLVNVARKILGNIDDMGSDVAQSPSPGNVLLESP